MNYKVLVTDCIQCKKAKRMSLQTFLCEACFTTYSNELRQKYGKYVRKQVVTKKKQKRVITGEFTYWLNVALQKGVPEGTYRSRVYGGQMTYEEAATLPPKKPQRHKAKIDRLRKIARKEGKDDSYSRIYYLLVTKKLNEDEVLENLAKEVTK